MNNSARIFLVHISSLSTIDQNYRPKASYDKLTWQNDSPCKKKNGRFTRVTSPRSALLAFCYTSLLRFLVSLLRLVTRLASYSSQVEHTSRGNVWTMGKEHDIYIYIYTDRRVSKAIINERGNDYTRIVAIISV